MNNSTWLEELKKLNHLLSSFSFRDEMGGDVSFDEGFALWRRWTVELREKRRLCFLIGNGASASMASHISADLAKNAHVHTQVFSDLSLITAMANDISYDAVYSEPLRRRGALGDMLVAISSSGRSENILNAVSVARELGMTVITLSAMSSENPLRMGGSLNAYVPAETYGHAETCHAAILHFWMDSVSLDGRKPLDDCLSRKLFAPNQS
ncbi:MAG: SIS domain-containing protein [Nitrospinae bacterium]|nr:SIS domain-containing protein [Nitrospinota bacterium]